VDAQPWLVILEQFGCRTGLQWVNAGAARCRGMLAEDDCYEQEFETALALCSAEMGFERARTQLALGMRRRRSRRRANAQAVLHEALAYFERNGAEPWAEQARAELRASGEVASRETTSSLASLTAQEASGPDRVPGHQQSRGCRGALPEPEDRRVPSRQHLPQTRCPFTRRTDPTSRGPQLTNQHQHEMATQLSHQGPPRGVNHSPRSLRVQQQSTAVSPLPSAVQRCWPAFSAPQRHSARAMPSLCKQGVRGSSPLGSTQVQSHFRRLR
jgi:hypothetical protein